MEMDIYQQFVDAIVDTGSELDAITEFRFHDGGVLDGRWATLQLNGCQLVICSNGKWSLDDTSGG